MERYAYILRDAADRAGVLPLKQVIAAPGVKAAFRVIVHFMDQRAVEVITTLTQRQGSDPLVEVVYAGRFGNRPIQRRMSPADYERLTHTLLDLKFDKLIDQPQVPVFGIDLCMVERGSGGYLKGVIFAPQTADGVYASLYNAIRAYLPEAVREVT
jgi:hypothetical protein